MDDELVATLGDRLDDRRADRAEPDEADDLCAAQAPAAAACSDSNRSIASSATRNASIAAGTPQ